MKASEKSAHPWACDQSRGDIQCPYVTSNQDGEGLLYCCWRDGHPGDLGHQTGYGGDDSRKRWTLTVSDPEVIIDDLREQLVAKEKALAEVCRAVLDWVCPQCRHVAPGPPPEGTCAYLCAKCSLAMVPLHHLEMCEMQNFLKHLAKLLAEPRVVPHSSMPIYERLFARVEELLHERSSARSGEHEAYTQVADLHAQLDRTRQERDEVVAVAAEIRKSCADLRLQVRDLEEDLARSRREGAALRQQAEASGSMRDALAGAERRGQIA